MRQIVVSGAEGRLARGWGGDGLHEASQLEVDLFKFSDGVAQSTETGRAVGWECVKFALVCLAIVVRVVVVDEGGQGSGCAGMRKGVGGRVLELKIKCFPLLKEGGGRGRIRLRIRKEEVMVIVIE